MQFIPSTMAAAAAGLSPLQLQVSPDQRELIIPLPGFHFDSTEEPGWQEVASGRNPSAPTCTARTRARAKVAAGSGPGGSAARSLIGC